MNILYENNLINIWYYFLIIENIGFISVHYEKNNFESSNNYKATSTLEITDEYH